MTGDKVSREVEEAIAAIRASADYVRRRLAATSGLDEDHAREVAVLRRRLEAAESLAEAVADFLPDICAEETSGGTRGVCTCDLRAAVAAYREASK